VGVVARKRAGCGGGRGYVCVWLLLWSGGDVLLVGVSVLVLLLFWWLRCVVVFVLCWCVVDVWVGVLCWCVVCVC